MHKENPIHNCLCWCLKPILELDSFFILMKSMKITSKFYSISSISHSGVEFEQIFYNSRKPRVSRFCKATNIHNCFCFLCAIWLQGCLIWIPKSHSEYLVRNPVQSAYQQNLVVQGVKCVLYKICSVYCTNVPFVLYNVRNMYCTRCAVGIVQGV